MGIIGILAYLEDTGILSANLDIFYDILLPIFFVSIIEGVLVHIAKITECNFSPTNKSQLDKNFNVLSIDK